MTRDGLPAFYRLHRYDAIDSSNAEAKRLAAAGAPEGTLVVAAEQTGGRGRGERLWTSPPGNFYGSLLLRPAVPAATAAQLSFVAAVAVAVAIERVADVRPRLKWPNDVLIDGRKCCGILLESALGRGGAPDWVVVGIGVNVASHPDGLERPATSLHREGASEVTVEAVMRALAKAFLEGYEAWKREGFAPVRTAWLARAAGLGQALEVRLGRERFTGRFRDLDAGGALIVDLPAGGARRVEAGEVFMVPA